MKKPVRRPRGAARFVFGIVAALMVCTFGCGDDGEGGSVSTSMRGATVARPMVEGPVTGGNGVPFLATTTFDLAQVGYSQAEYFISGRANAYKNGADGLLGADGKWTISTADSAAYKTRIVVYRPIDAAKFNGTVVVEWLNVSGGLDAAADWIQAHVELTRGGFAYVAVSAQYLGVEGGTSLLGLPAIPLKTNDPVRYGSLTHPGDSFSYDIYSQAGQAIRRPVGVDPLGGLAIKAVIAAGESQSAFRMVTYINGIHPLADLYDGFLVHSRGNLPAALSETPQPQVDVPGTAMIRDDLNVPVLMFETESDLTFLGYLPLRQPDSERFRLWEVPGTAHADTYTTVTGGTDLGNSPDAANIVLTTMPALGFTCRKPINSGPHHYVLNGAVAALNRWVRNGTPPPTAPRVQGMAGPPIRVVRDTNGNARGGIRTPQVDVPIATLSGEGQSGSIFCALFGTTAVFDDTKLKTLYPDHATYVSLYGAATDSAVRAGFLLPEDAALMKAAAASSDVGN